MINGKLAIAPGFVDALDFHRRDGDANLRVCVPGEVVSYNAAQRTVNVLPSYNRVYNDGTVVPMPELVDLPVYTPQGGTGSVNGGVHVGLPIEPGDECVVVCSDISIDAWFANGGQQTPISNARHKVSDAFAFVGVNSRANPLVSFLAEGEGGLASETTKLAINPETGLITVGNTTATLAQILANLVSAISATNAPAGTNTLALLITAVSTLAAAVAALTTAEVAAGPAGPSQVAAAGVVTSLATLAPAAAAQASAGQADAAAAQAFAEGLFY